MKTKNFVSLLLGTIGGIIFAIGMCMCLLPEWNAFRPGVIIGCVGAVILLVMLLVRRKMENKPLIRLNGRIFGLTAYGIVSALMLGTGMCMTMVWSNLMIQGVIVGCIGIVMLICLAPLCKGLIPDAEKTAQQGGGMV